MASIVIPAHNESAVIARLLSQLVSSEAPDPLDVIVVCNGCTDNTAEVCRAVSPRVRVIETETASKIHALNCGDKVAVDFPRLYLDADVVITGRTVSALFACLEEGPELAAAPLPFIDTSASSILVKTFYKILAKLPSTQEGIGGSGAYALSESGRARFGEFPNLVADDLFVRLMFKPNERKTLVSERSTVFAPRTLDRLISVKTRAYFGNMQLSAIHPELYANASPSNTMSLGRLFLNPILWPGLVIYIYVVTISRIRARRRWRDAEVVWERDDSTRVAQ
jgi:glycosyltransferase involved in cell wall biosynthesis